MKMITEQEALIRKVARLFCKDLEERRDLFQEIVFRLWQGFPFYRREASETTWVYTVALHTARLAHRSKRIQLVFTDEMREEFHPVAPAADPLEQAMEVVYGMRDADKAILLLLLEGYLYPEISGILGIAPNTLRQRIHRLRNRLKDKITL